ncbi:hypothetical protein MRB53_030450 [Persea americana]|uniref:Uncharacterized protein n=1 Tax=Persea americana TaxID=3435 RepID=A0ACC2KLJ4_PERAE|nr:hypothetical protein MRB53_030450 [Persea americana]
MGRKLDGKIMARERGVFGIGVFLAGSDGCRAVEDADDAGKKNWSSPSFVPSPLVPRVNGLFLQEFQS